MMHVCFLLRKKFRGITSNPTFAAAIHQSFANQTANSTALLTAGDVEHYGEDSRTIVNHSLPAFKRNLLFMY